MTPTPHELHNASMGLVGVTVGTWLIVYSIRRPIGRFVGKLLGGKSVRNKN